MTQVIGEVAAASSKQLPSGTYYSFCVDDVWYRTGREDSGVQKGYRVKFDFTEDKYGKHAENIQFKAGEAPPADAKKPYGGGKKSSYDPQEAKRREKYWAEKELRDIENQKRISYQAATNTALAIVTAAMEKELVAVPKGKNLGAKFEAFQAMVDEEAERIFRIYDAIPANYEALVASDEVQERPTDFDEEVNEDSSDQADPEAW
jgi:hypothetical protein